MTKEFQNPQQKPTLIRLEAVKALWQFDGGKMPSSTTVWRYIRKGLIPKPVMMIGSANLFDQNEVIRLRDKFLNRQ